MTGRLPVRMGIGTAGDVFTSEAEGGIPANETTIAEALKETHRSGLIGKTTLGVYMCV